MAHWLDRYPPNPQTDATFDKATGLWKVQVWSGRAGEIALGKVADADGRVVEAWTGPQVAWGMARGRVGSFGGKALNAWWTWISLSIVFVVGLVDRRRLRSWHTLDLLALVSFGLSLWRFNQGDVFGAASVGAPPLAYLAARTSWIGFRGRAFDPALSWPVWLLAAVAVFLGGLRIGLNVENPHGVIDVGYAGVIGGDRLLDGAVPVRAHAGRRTRPGRAGPRIRRGRRVTGSRRTAAASPRTPAATRMGRSPTSSTSRPSSSCSGTESGIRFRLPTRRRSRST